MSSATGRSEAVAPPALDPTSAAPVRARRWVALDGVSVAVVWAAGASVFFRAQLTSGFNRTMGNDGDARLIVFFCEHWYLLLRGHGSWRNLAFFYPIKGLLGWSDSLFLYEIFYTPLRFVGCDPYLAFQLSLVLLSAVGFTAFVVFVRTAFRAPPLVALLGGLLFTFPNALWLHTGSPQLLGIYIVPVILLIGLAAWRALPDRPGRSAALAATAGLAWALLFYTAYYVAWFFALGSSVAVLVVIVGGPRAFFSAASATLRTAWRSALAAVAGMAVGIVPFALTYLPVLHQFGALRYAQAMNYAPHWQGLIDVGPGNVLWSGLIRRFVSPRLLAPYELTFAVTPVLLTLAVAGGVIAAWRLRTGRAASPGAARSAAVLAATALVLYVLPVRSQAHGTLWAIVWHIPGAAAIRAIDRLQVVTGLAVSLAVVAASTELSADLRTGRATGGRLGAARHGPSRRRGARPAVGVALLLVAVVEQFNTTDNAHVNRRSQVALLRSASAPPVGCRSFFVVDSSPHHLPEYDYQIDAMLVSQRLSVPTLNGYTAHEPPGWKLFRPFEAGYTAAVAAWADSHRVRVGLCQLDLYTMHWVADPSLPASSGRG